MSKRTVFSLLNRAAKKYKNKPYLSHKNDSGWIRTTFSEARDRSKILASALMNLGITYEDKIGILSEAKTDWIIAELATLYAGAIAVPLSIKLLPEEVPFRINHSDSKLFFVSENTLEKVIGQWDKYDSKGLKLLVLDAPSEKITKQCLKYKFDEKQLIFIEDLYRVGAEKMSENASKIEAMEEQIQEDDVVTISYTSGTTGNPKGIMLTHLNYHSNSTEAVTTFKIKEFLSTLIILPTDHSFAHTIGIYTAMVSALSLHFVDARGGGMNALKNIPPNMIEAESNFLLTVPALTSNFIHKIQDGIKEKGSLIEALFKSGLKAGIIRNGDGFTKPNAWVQFVNYFSFKLADVLIFKKLREIWGPNIEFFVGGGALLDIKQQQFFKAIGVPVYQGYGLTEASPIISTNTPHEHKMGTSGRLLNGLECKIIGDGDVEMPKGEKGEIVVRGDNVMKGYYKNPKATRETLRNGWLYTGDLGYFDEDAFLVVVGREKALLISEDGEKYSPEEIEEAIVSNSHVINQAMIYNDHKKSTTALLTLDTKKFQDVIKNDKILSHDEIVSRTKLEMVRFKDQLEFKDKFPEKWIPTNFQIIEEDFTEENKMINSTLKMVRHKITESYQDRLDVMYHPKAQVVSHEENKKVTARLFNFD